MGPISKSWSAAKGGLDVRLFFLRLFTHLFIQFPSLTVFAREAERPWQPVEPSVLTMASSRDSSATFRRAGISADVLQSTFERFDADKGWLQL